LCPLLVDEDPGVRAATAESLASVSSMGHSIAEHLIHLDIMTSIESAVDKLPSGHKDTPTFCHLCDTLSNLCSMSEKAIDVFASTSIPSKMISIISQPLVSERIARHVAAIQLMLTCMEGTTTIPGTTDRSLLAVLVKLVNTGMQVANSLDVIDEAMETQFKLEEELTERAHLTSLASLLLLNLASVSTCQMSSAERHSLNKLVMSKGKEILDKDTTSLFVKIERIINSNEDHAALALATNMGMKKESNDESKNRSEQDNSSDSLDLTMTKNSLKNLIQSKSLVIELITKILDNETEESDDEEDEEDEDEDDVEIDVGENEIEEEFGVTAQVPSLNEVEMESMEESSDELKLLVNDFKLVESILGLLQDPIPEQERLKEFKCTLKKLPLGKGVLDDWRELQVTVLTAVSNIGQTMPAIFKDYEEQFHDCLMSILTTEKTEEDADLFRSLIQAIRSVVGSQLITLSPDCVKAFAQIIKCHGEKSDKASVISCIKILGSVASQSTCKTIIISVANLLLQLLEEEEPIVVEDNNCIYDKLVIMAEMLDTLMDIFSEDNKTDDIISSIELQLLPRLSRLDKIFCSLVKRRGNGKRQRKQDFAVIQTVADNVKRFIRYKIDVLKKKII